MKSATIWMMVYGGGELRLGHEVGWIRISSIAQVERQASVRDPSPFVWKLWFYPRSPGGSWEYYATTRIVEDGAYYDLSLMGMMRSLAAMQHQLMIAGPYIAVWSTPPPDEDMFGDY